MNFDPDEMEAQFESVDPKVLQIQQLQELMAIRQQLQMLNQSLSTQSESETKTYTCRCGEEVPKGERISHAQDVHGAPSVDDPDELHLYQP